MPNDLFSENARNTEKPSGAEMVSWFEANRESSKTAKRFFELAEQGWTVPSSDAEASE